MLYQLSYTREFTIKCQVLMNLPFGETLYVSVFVVLVVVLEVDLGSALEPRSVPARIL